VSFDDERRECPFLIQPGIVPRPANALCIEAGAWPSARCTLKLPEHWKGPGASALRWLGSGGSALVFGRCTANCPRESTKPEGSK
jgi:hypothetical protein